MSGAVKPPRGSGLVDLVVCLPVGGFHSWYDEGGTPEFPDEYEYEWVVGRRPPPALVPGESRLYVVCAGALRGFAPILRIDELDTSHWAIVRDGETAQAITIEAHIPSFRSWRYRWWSRDLERVFIGWAWEAVPPRPGW